MRHSNPEDIFPLAHDPDRGLCLHAMSLQDSTRSRQARNTERYLDVGSCLQ